jgi:proline racemase
MTHIAALVTLRMVEERGMVFSGVINAVDVHASGAHGRVVLGGVGVLDAPGKTMFEKMLYFEREADWFRRLMIREPRGYPGACVNIVLPPTIPEADAGYVIMEQPDYYPAMSGSNTMCVVTALLETGTLPISEPVTNLLLETPAGLIRVRADCAGGRVTGVTLDNVASFASHLDTPIEVPGVGTVPVDVAYGGMVYVIAEAALFGLEIVPEQGARIVDQALNLLAAARRQLTFRHPENPSIDLIESVHFYAPPKDPANSARNAVVLSHGAIDRCPCGTGTSARMAALHAKGQLPVGSVFRNEGILDTVFTGQVISETRAGHLPAIVPAITGRAWITGFAQYVVAPDDPFPEGFRLGDIWPGSFAGAGEGPLAAGVRGAS